ncbi:hypothetical protein [Streptomyces sp. NPDC048639]|uniref:hypothetical protein n=1 Tax=Streptomyces sp. NPDC048639 TaxID=3365581 RepID=UPI003724A7D8
MVVLLFAGGCIAIVVGISNEASKETTVKYTVTGDARDVSIAYSTWHDDNLSTSQQTVARLPWTKEVKTTGLTRGGSLSVTTGAAGGSVKCSVAANDGKPNTATASGEFATATCDDF